MIAGWCEYQHTLVIALMPWDSSRHYSPRCPTE